MRPTEKGRAPRQAPIGMHNGSSNSRLHYTLQAGALIALDTELAILVTAAHQLAKGEPLTWKDEARLHEAHQFLIRILADLRGVEVLT